MIGELHFLTAAEASRLIQSRQLSPVELVEAFLRRIEAVDGAVHSYITVLGEQASEAARVAEREIAAGEYRGALHGIPYGLKDIIHVAGIPTTACSRLMLDYRPAASATIALKLQGAGAILLGKLNTYEFGSGMAEDALELPFPPARNPWNLAHFTGGSSTGCGAAVAAGTAMIAIGADTGGSVRLPAAGCGLVGLKPTYGLVSRAGILPNSFTLDCVGPLAWTVEDAAMTLQGVGVAGHDVLDPASADTDIPDYRATLGAGIAGLRVGIVRRFHEIDHPADPEVAAAFEESVRVFRALGAQVVEIDFPASQQNFLDCLKLISASEFYSLHEPYFLARRGEMGAAVRDKLAMGASVSASDYLPGATLAPRVRCDGRRRVCALRFLPVRWNAACRAPPGRSGGRRRVFDRVGDEPVQPDWASRDRCLQWLQRERPAAEYPDRRALFRRGSAAPGRGRARTRDRLAAATSAVNSKRRRGAGRDAAIRQANRRGLRPRIPRRCS